jgi:hypothetical protein
MEKYYTPKIEEFHVGFEYQYNNASTRPKEEQEWSDTKTASGMAIESAEYDMSDQPPENEREARRNGFRVKHLDREDIESFGFFAATSSGMANSYGKRDSKNELRFVLHEQHQDKTIKIECVLYYDAGKRTIFEGTIKNKSELKRLLKQLGI